MRPLSQRAGPESTHDRAFAASARLHVGLPQARPR